MRRRARPGPGPRQVSASSLLGRGVVTIDPNQVQAAVDRYLAPTGHRGVAQVNGDQVIVTVTFGQPMQILGIVGKFSASVTGTGAAQAVRGITAAGN